MGEWTLITYLQAGAYAAIMAAVVGVPQMLSSYFDLRARRIQEERQEEIRREERRLEEERRIEERRLDEEIRRDERRQDAEAAERRHRELLVALIGAVGNGNNRGNGQGELIRTLQQTIEDLRAENERLRKQNGDEDLS